MYKLLIKVHVSTLKQQLRTIISKPEIRYEQTRRLVLGGRPFNVSEDTKYTIRDNVQECVSARKRPLYYVMYEAKHYNNELINLPSIFSSNRRACYSASAHVSKKRKKRPTMLVLHNVIVCCY